MNSSSHKRRLKIAVVSLIAMLCLALVVTYLNAKKQAVTDIRNLNLAIESQLHLALLEQMNAALLAVPYTGSEHHAVEGSAGSRAMGFALKGPEAGALALGALLQKISVEDSTASLGRGPGRLAPAEIDSGPALFSRDGSSNALIATMSVKGANDSSRTWITARIDLGLIKKLFNEFDVGVEGVIELRNTSSSSLVVRRPEPIAQALVYQPDVIDLRVQEGDREGVLTMASRIDGTERLYGFKRVGDTSLVLVTGLATREYLKEWGYSTFFIFIFAVVLICTIFIFARYLRYFKSTRATAAAKLRAYEERTQLLADSVGQAILCLDIDGNCNYQNKASASLFGVDQHGGIRRSLLAAFFPKNPKNSDLDFSGRVMKTLSIAGTCYFETTLLVGNGRKTPVEIHGYPYYADDEFVGAVLTIRDVSEQILHKGQISFLAYHDILTELPNRLFIQERFEELASQDCALSLLYLDVDHFKLINDSLGHVRGDQLLCTVAHRLKSLGGVDTVARLGGDEFLLLVPSSSVESIAALAIEISDAVSRNCEIDDFALTITPSIGAALYPSHGSCFIDLMQAADIALYQAKSAGRNTWKLYEHEMGLKEMRRLELQLDLRAAWENRDLTVFYQPQLELASGRIIGLEALLRWTHSTKGVVPPCDFIPAAEQCGLIIPISRWLFKEVCNQAVCWRRLGLGDLVIAVNCSAVQFHQGELVEDLKAVLRDTSLSPEFLELEITESILIEDTPKVARTIAELKSIGVRLSIDDFGTGYSSMSYLKRFAVDKLKIDQSFVSGMLKNAQDAAIVKSVIGLAHTLQMTVTAEGVETTEVATALTEIGCDEAQGYLFSRPVQAREIEILLRNNLRDYAKI